MAGRLIRTFSKKMLWCIGIVSLIMALLIWLVIATGFLSNEAVVRYGVTNAPHSRAALLISGDMGLDFGMSGEVASRLGEKGIPVIGLNAPSLFGHQRTQEDVDHIVASNIERTIKETGADKIILIGHSFGADIIASSLASLPPALRAHIEAIVLVVPAQAAYFRADPTGLDYNGRPDALPSPTVRKTTWAPIICIYGAEETDSLCPDLIGGQAVVVELSGGHHLNRDIDRLVKTILMSLGSIEPERAGRP